jgi:hypothetical protein
MSLYHSADPAADAERWYCDHERQDEEFCVDVDCLIGVRIKAADSDEAESKALDIILELLRGVEEDNRVTVTDWKGIEDVSEGGY